MYVYDKWPPAEHKTKKSYPKIIPNNTTGFLALSVGTQTKKNSFNKNPDIFCLKKRESFFSLRILQSKHSVYEYIAHACRTLLCRPRGFYFGGRGSSPSFSRNSLMTACSILRRPSISISRGHAKLIRTYPSPRKVFPSVRPTPARSNSNAGLFHLKIINAPSETKTRRRCTRTIRTERNETNSLEFASLRGGRC